MTQEEVQRFVDAKVSKKQSILLDQKVTPAKAEKYLSICELSTVNCTDVVNDNVANKVDTICEGECRAIKDVAIKNVTEAEAGIEKLLDQNINKTNEQILMLTKTSAALTRIGQFAQQWREEMHNPAELTERLYKQIHKAAKDKVLDAQVAYVLKQKVESSLVIDPSAPQNSVESVIANVNKATRQANYEKEGELRGLDKKKLQARNYMETTKREIRAMSGTDKLTKSADAVGGVLTAVNKFKTGDEVKIMSGCLDIGNAAAQFMPPPASLVTQVVTDVFNLVAGVPPDPSNQQVIDGINATLNAGFAKQKSFLEKKFEKHKEFITDEFQSLESTLKEEFKKADNATKAGLQKLENALNKGFEGVELGFQKLANALNEGFEGVQFSNNEGFAEQRKFIGAKFTEDHLRKVKNNALAQMVAVEEKFIFIEQYRDVQVDDNVANLIAREIAALSSTHNSALSKTTFEDICPGILDDDYAVSKWVRRKYCATLLYAYLIVEQDRSIVLDQLNVLLGRNSLGKLPLYDGYLQVSLHRKKEVVDFVTKTVLEEEMGCSLFNPQAGTAVLTYNQTKEMSSYIDSLAKGNWNHLKGSIEAFQTKTNCSSK